jgi:hypothetical protein
MDSLLDNFLSWRQRGGLPLYGTIQVAEMGVKLPMAAMADQQIGTHPG